MSYSSGLNARQAAAEHVLAVSRDFISQPRLSEYLKKISKKKENIENFGP